MEINREAVLEKFETVMLNANTSKREAMVLRAGLKCLGYGVYGAPYYSDELNGFIVVPDCEDYTEDAWELAKLGNVDHNCTSEENVGYCDICGKEYWNDDDGIYFGEDGCCHAECYFVPDNDYAEYLEEHDGDVIYLPDCDGDAFDDDNKQPTCYAKNATFVGYSNLDTGYGGAAVRIRETLANLSHKYGVAFSCHPVMRPAHGMCWRGWAAVWVWAKTDEGLRPLTEAEKAEVYELVKSYLGDED